MQYQIHHIKKFNKISGLKYFDKMLLAIAFLGPALTIPQITKIFYLQNANSISLTTWLLYAILDIPWIIFGIIHKNLQITIAYICWFIINIIVVTGTILYG